MGGNKAPTHILCNSIHTVWPIIHITALCLLVQYSYVNIRQILYTRAYIYVCVYHFHISNQRKASAYISHIALTQNVNKIYDLIKAVHISRYTLP